MLGDRKGIHPVKMLLNECPKALDTFLGPLANSDIPEKWLVKGITMCARVYYYAHPHRGGALCIAFVCSSVCPSVSFSLAFVTNSSRIKKPRKPKISKKGLHHTCDLRTSFKVKRSMSPGRLMLTQKMRNIFRTASRTNFKLGTLMEHEDPHHPQVQ